LSAERVKKNVSDETFFHGVVDAAIASLVGNGDSPRYSDASLIATQDDSTIYVVISIPMTRR